MRVPDAKNLFKYSRFLWCNCSLPIMKLILVALCFLTVAYCQTQHKNGNPTGEIGQPAFDEIIVESTLTVRGKSGSRSGKSLITSPKQKEPEVEADKETVDTLANARVSARRSKRAPKLRYGHRLEEIPRGPIGGNHFPGSSSSHAHASSNAFNSHSPFGSFGASASQSSTQSQNFGPNGFQGGAGHSASQTYNLPNGSKISISFSNSFSIDNGIPTSSNSHAFTITGPDGKPQRLFR